MKEFEPATKCEKKLADIICADGFDYKRFVRISEALIRRTCNRQNKFQKENGYLFKR
jgi:hypothetical protein